MPSSGCNYSSDSDQVKTKSPHEILKEWNILESLLEEARNDSEVPVTFENLTGMNHKFMAEYSAKSYSIS